MATKRPPTNTIEFKMKNVDLQSMSLDELWSLYEKVTTKLNQKTVAELANLDRRLRQLGTEPKRLYPKTAAKYRNPKNYSPNSKVS
jgi:hypothetical protein